MHVQKALTTRMGHALYALLVPFLRVMKNIVQLAVQGISRKRLALHQWQHAALAQGAFILMLARLHAASAPQVLTTMQLLNLNVQLVPLVPLILSLVPSPSSIVKVAQLVPSQKARYP